MAPKEIINLLFKSLLLLCFSFLLQPSTGFGASHLKMHLLPAN